MKVSKALYKIVVGALLAASPLALAGGGGGGMGGTSGSPAPSPGPGPCAVPAGMRCDSANAGSIDPKVTFERYTAAQRPRGDPGPRSQGPDDRGQRLVPRGLGLRGVRQERVRAPVRAHAVPGLEARRRRQPLRHPQDDRGGHGQRHDQPRSHELLRGGPVEPARDRAVARERSHGLPDRAARRREGPREPLRAEPREPDRRGPQRAPPALRQRPLRQDPVRDRGGPVPRGAPVPLPDDRQARGPDLGVRPGREELLPHLVRAGERDDRDRGRLRRRRGQGAGRQVVRQVPREHAAVAGQGARADHQEQRGHDHRRLRQAPPDRVRVALARELRGRRRGARHRGERAVPRGAGPALQGAGLRSPARAERDRVPVRELVLGPVPGGGDAALGRGPRRGQADRARRGRPARHRAADRQGDRPRDRRQRGRRDPRARDAVRPRRGDAGLQPLPRRSGPRDVGPRSLPHDHARGDPRRRGRLPGSGQDGHRDHGADRPRPPPRREAN